MKNYLAPLALSFGLALAHCGTTRADAPDFTPGVATDGNHYDLSDLKGKVVVLFFFEAECPRCKGLVPERNKMVQSFAGKPVKFVAVDPGHNLQEAVGYTQETKLVMPIYADPLRVMEARYGEHISLQNVYQFKVIGPAGNVVGYDEAAINTALADAKWKYKDKGYDPKLNPAIEAFEWNQDVLGLRLLKPSLTSSNKPLAADAQKLLDEIKAEAQQWKTDADSDVDSKPVEAYDLYTRVAQLFPRDELGKSVADPLKKLSATPDVKSELAARKMFDQVSNAMTHASTDQKAAVVQFCRSVAKKYPSTPTGQKATALADEMSKPS